MEKQDLHAHQQQRAAEVPSFPDDLNDPRPARGLPTDNESEFWRPSPRLTSGWPGGGWHFSGHNPQTPGLPHHLCSPMSVFLFLG